MIRIAYVLTAAGLLGGAGVAAAPPAQSASDVVYQSVGKRMAPVTLTSDAEYRADVGQPVTVPLTFRLLDEASDVQVEIHAESGLWLAKGRQRVAVGAVGKGRFQLPSVEVTPLANGRHYLNVTVFVGEPSATRFRSFAIPVQVGAPVAQKSTQIVRGVDGRPLRVLPARERP